MERNQGRKSVEPPTGADAVLGAGLAVDRHVGGHRDVGRHADFLAAGDAHAIDAADHRLLAVEDAVDHGVEQIHVLAVLIGSLGVVGGVLGRIAAGTEGLVADGGEHRGDDLAVA